MKLNRPASLKDHARAALFLVSDDSAYVSGVVLPSFDGGTLSRVAMMFPEDGAPASDGHRRRVTIIRRLVVDRSACAGHGLCYGRAPVIVDCDDSGYPVLRHDALVSDERIAAGEEVVEMCPERALRIEAFGSVGLDDSSGPKTT